MSVVPTSVAKGEDISVANVLENGLCIGCGACAIGRQSRYSIAEVSGGFLSAQPNAAFTDDGGPDVSGLVCPHSGVGPNETDLAAGLFAHDADYDTHVGYWQSAGVMAMKDEPDRLKGSSGGGVTWMLRELLRRGLVDSVLHVKAREGRAGSDDAHGDGPLYEYALSKSQAELESGRKSAYYPVSMSGVIELMTQNDGRYAVVAIPCFAKALRRLSVQNELVKSRLAYVVGIVCGHLKSKYYSEFLAWSVGVPPDKIDSIDFRRKLPGGGAGDYGIATKTPDRIAVSSKMANYFGTPWELGFMMYKACDYCDDVFCETADIVFGDAWIPPYDRDWRGHNVVVSRRRELTDILGDLQNSEEVEFEPIALERVIASQAGGLRHRREGLSVRLANDDAAGVWRPEKRVAADPVLLNSKRGRTFLQRMRLRQLSVRWFARAKRLRSFAVFGYGMSWPVFLYYLSTRNLNAALRQIYPTKQAMRTARTLLSKLSF